jgi:hypothetical protein
VLACVARHQHLIATGAFTFPFDFRTEVAMSRAARSIYVFGFYLIATGGILIGAPNALLALIGLPPTTDPWIRVLGVAVMAIGLLHVACGRSEQTGFFRASVTSRVFVFVAFVALAAMKLIPPVIILFGVVDLAGAAWTRISLRTAEPVVAA